LTLKIGSGHQHVFVSFVEPQTPGAQEIVGDIVVSVDEGGVVWLRDAPGAEGESRVELPSAVDEGEIVATYRPTGQRITYSVPSEVWNAWSPKERFVLAFIWGTMTCAVYFHDRVDYDEGVARISASLTFDHSVARGHQSQETMAALLSDALRKWLELQVGEYPVISIDVDVCLDERLSSAFRAAGDDYNRDLSTLLSKAASGTTAVEGKELAEALTKIDALHDRLDLMVERQVDTAAELRDLTTKLGRVAPPRVMNRFNVFVGGLRFWEELSSDTKAVLQQAETYFLSEDGLSKEVIRMIALSYTDAVEREWARARWKYKRNRSESYRTLRNDLIHQRRSLGRDDLVKLRILVYGLAGKETELRPDPYDRLEDEQARSAKFPRS